MACRFQTPGSFWMACVVIWPFYHWWKCFEIHMMMHKTIRPSITAKPSSWNFLNFWTWQQQKRRKSVRHPLFLKFDNTSKTQHELDSIKNEALLWDLLQTGKVECRADGPLPVRFVIFPFHLSKASRLPWKKWGQVVRSAAPVTQNHLSKPDDRTL